MIHITIDTAPPMKNPLIAKARELLFAVTETAEECLLVLESADIKIPAKVTPKIYQRFVDTGKVPRVILKMIATKMSENEKLSNLEIAIFAGKTAEINELLIIIKQKNETTSKT